MALANFQILSPQQANPLYNALQNMGKMQDIRQQQYQTKFMPQLLQQQLQQQKYQTEFMPETLRAGASKVSLPGLIAQALAEFARNKQQSGGGIGGMLSSAGHAIASPFESATHWLLSHHSDTPDSSQGIQSGNSNLSLQATNENTGDQNLSNQGYVPVKVGNKTYMYNPQTQHFR